MVNTVINNVDQTTEANGRQIIVEYHDTVSGDTKQTAIDYDTLSAGDKTKIDEAVALVQSLLPS